EEYWLLVRIYVLFSVCHSRLGLATFFFCNASLSTLYLAM
ncbi:hypothetical protein GMORB2_4994, partial [Geosmithia morbida]